MVVGESNLGRYGQGWAEVGSSRYDRLIRQGWVTHLAGVCVCVPSGQGLVVDGCTV